MTTVVLIHGLAGSPANWSSVIPLLGDAPSRVVTATVGRAASIEAEADHVVEQMGRTDGPAILVGHSMGGLIATAVAERHPHLAERLVLVNTPPSLASRLSARSGGERVFSLPVVGELVWRLLPDAVLLKGIATSFAPGASVPASALSDLRSTGRRNFVSASANIDAYLSGGTLQSRLSALACPTDVVYGVLDQRVDPAAFAPLHQDGRVTATPIPNAGHMSPWEAPDAVAAVIRSALDV